jgi:hypothetical protein
VSNLRYIPGPPGPRGPIGPSSGPGFVFNKATPGSIWTIVHNLGRHPSVTVVDSGGRKVEGDVIYGSDNSVVVSFSAPFSGTAYLN